MASEAVRVEYSKMRAQISTIAQKIHELDQERNEYDLVVKALDPMDKERKCFRLVGGVLVERTVKEVLPAIAHNLEGIEKLVTSLMDQLKTLEKQADDFRAQHNLTFNKEDTQESGPSDKKSTGVLV